MDRSNITAGLSWDVCAVWIIWPACPNGTAVNSVSQAAAREVFYRSPRQPKAKNVDPKRIEGARYYDGVNFARRVKCDSWFSFSYNDEVVPPTSSYSTYNIVTAPKTLSVYQQTGHFWYLEQWDEWENWLLKQMGL